MKINSMELRNRAVMPAMTTRLAAVNGSVTQHLIDYYSERAKGPGLVIVEAASIDSPIAKFDTNQLSIDNNRYIAGLNDLSENIKWYGAKVALQLCHAGRQTNLEITEGKQPVSPSDVPFIDPFIRGESPPSIISQPRSLSINEIEDIIEMFAEAALRAKNAGFDAVELHGAHGYLILQFLSPYTNKRTDKYGGDPERRMRFALKVLEHTREKVGSNFPILFRISADEYIEGGVTLDYAKTITQRLEEASLDAINVTAGIHESEYMVEGVEALPPGYIIHLAEGIKKVVDIPVIAVGRINDPIFADKLLREGRADLVSMGRAMISDPQLLKKAAEGRFDEIRRCIACNMCINYPRIRCTVNVAAGREREFKITRAERSKKVLVVGGGPAGMEAARVATMRGHNVTIIEKKAELGGQLLLAAKPPHKEDYPDLVNYFREQIKRLGVKVELDKEATPEIVEQRRPDAVILATGAEPNLPEIPGIHRKNVVTAWDVLEDRFDLGESVLVAGGGMVGCETAEFLVERGKKVTIIEMLKYVATDVQPYVRHLLVKRLIEKKVKIFTNTRIKEITDNGVSVIDNKKRKQIIKSDTVVLALGAKANKSLEKTLRGKFKEIRAIGDCVEPRRLIEAIYEGARIGLEI